MSLGGTIRRTIFWHNDKRSGAGLWNAYMDVKSILDNYNPENEYKIRQRVTSLLKHAADTTAFYSKYGPDDLNNFPIINKQMINEHRKDFLSSNYRGEKLHEIQTSGSTGIPFTMQQNAAKRQRVIAEIKALNDYTGYLSHEKMLYIQGAVRKEWHYSKKQQFKENIYRIPVAVNDNAAEKRLVDFLVRKRPVALHASACDLYPLIAYIRKHNIPSSAFRLSTIITGSEMVPVRLRVDLAGVFGTKCHTYVKYSNQEMGILGLDTGVGTPYVLNVSNYYFEILKMESDEPAEEGELGRIVITDLFNYALPLIRYDTGDLGIIKQEPGEWPKLTELSGKRRDLLYNTNGDPISGSALTNLMVHARNVSMWQMVQKTEKDYVYKIVSEEGAMPLEKDILLEDIQKLFGADARIRVEYIDEIPTISSQKRRYTVNLYRPQ